MYTSLNSYITSRIYENQSQDISGTDLQEALLQMVATLGAGVQFGGFVTAASSVPQDFGDYPIAYFAYEAGTYSSFGGAVLDGTTLHILSYDGSWHDADTGIASGSALTAALAGKAEKDADAVEGNVAKFDSNGNPVDGGIPASNIAQKDGYYSTMVAGLAENLVGRGSVPAEYLYRTTGGSADVGTGTAQIKQFGGAGRVWNQLVNRNGLPSGIHSSFPDSVVDYTLNTTTGGITVHTNGNTQSSSCFAFSDRAYVSPNIPNHKYLVLLNGNTNSRIRISFGAAGVYGEGGFIVGHSTGSYMYIFFDAGLNIAESDAITFYPQVFDLTLMYGAGNEPTSVADFKADYPLAYYGYNTGKILPFAAEWLKTTGVNQWDEQWESGRYNPSNGVKESNSKCIRSKNYIQVFPSTGYLVNYLNDNTNTFIIEYDINKTFISFRQVSNQAPITTGANTRYITLFVGNSFNPVTTYNNDIQVALYWSGGEIPTTYHPYEEHFFNVPISTMTGKVNGEGESVTIFGADGIVKAGSVSDVLQVDADGYARTAVKRFAKVTFTGEETWGQIESYPYYYCSAIQGLNDGTQIPICNFYIGEQGGGGFPNDGGIKLVNGALGLAIVDPNYSTLALFKAHLADLYAAGSPLEVIYPLATPVEYVLDTPIFMGYSQNDWGTECWGSMVNDVFVPAIEASEPYTAPCNYDVQYPLNAVDLLRNLVRNYVSINASAADDSTLKTLASAINTALGIQITWTWDETNREYSFAVSDNRTFKVVSVPASASASGSAGNIAYDSDYLYVCIATNTWKRVALATW